METEQEYEYRQGRKTKKRKKQRQSSIIIYDEFSSLSGNDLVRTMDFIKARLLKIFREHIGEANAISPYDLFVSVFGRSPDTMNFFKRMYWWGIIKKIIKGLRKDGECFIINKVSKLFVLQSGEELSEFAKKVDNHILNLRESKRKAFHWVKFQNWKKLGGVVDLEGKK
jgi:hypothetical protein